jgi:hypothetical protein
MDASTKTTAGTNEVESLRAVIKLALDGLEQMTSRSFSEGGDRYIRDALRKALGEDKPKIATKPTGPVCPRCKRVATGWSLRRADVCSPKDWAQCIRQMADVEADIARRAEKKQRGATKAQLAHRAKLFAPASPSIHDDLAAISASIAGALKSAGSR